MRTRTKKTQLPSSSVKWLWTSSHRYIHADMMVGLTELPKEVQERLLEEHICANENNHLAREVHECTMSALLMVVHEVLLTSIPGEVFPAQSELISHA